MADNQFEAPSKGQALFKDSKGNSWMWRSPQSKTELAAYFLDFFGYTLADSVHPECRDRDHVAPLDVAWSFYSAHNYLERTQASPMGPRSPIGVLKATRGLAGKSTMLAGISTLEGLDGLDGTILGGSAMQSKRVHEVGTEIWEHVTTIDGKRVEGPLRHHIEDPTSMETKFIYSKAKRRALTASAKQARSPHPHRLRLDEVDEMELDIFESAMGQTISTDEEKLTHTAIASTHQHPHGTFSEVLTRANDRSWPVYQFCYKESLIENGGWLSQEQVELKRIEVSDRMFRIEYDLQDPSPEDRAFDEGRLKFLYNRSFGEYRGAQDDELEFACCSNYKGYPCAFHSYAIGADWAKDKDWTVIEVYRVDVHPWWRVGFLRTGRKPWPLIIDQFNKMAAKYPNAQGFHDATGMGGHMIDDFMTADAEGVDMVGKRRDWMFNSYIISVESMDKTGPYIEFPYKQHQYCTHADLFNPGAKHHPPDSVVAGAMANMATGQAGGTELYLGPDVRGADHVLYGIESEAGYGPSAVLDLDLAL